MSKSLIDRYRRVISREFGVSTDVFYNANKERLGLIHDNLLHERHIRDVCDSNTSTNIICIYYMKWMLENKDYVFFRLL